MSRIAEFANADDALRFMRMKGDDYTIVGGIQYLYAVMPKPRYPGISNGVEPPESEVGRYVDPDEEY